MATITFYGIDMEYVKNVVPNAQDITENTCTLNMTFYDFETFCLSAFKGVQGVKVCYNTSVVIDHTPCEYCDSEWGIAHEQWCRTRFD